MQDRIESWNSKSGLKLNGPNLAAKMGDAVTGELVSITISNLRLVILQQFINAVASVFQNFGS